MKNSSIVRGEACSAFTLAKEEDTKSYWKLLVRVWKKFNLKLVVADMIKSVDKVLELSGIKTALP